jgi:hypothetical protein
MAQQAAQPWNLSSRTQIQAIRTPRLQDAQNQIRLLSFQSGSGADPIACDYTVHSFSDPLEYIGISYTWGDPTPTHTISIDGQSIRVHKNCFEALWQARHNYPPFLGIQHFWIDALCIDQSNVQEKSLQVQAMSKIFGCAARVAVSLGPSDGVTDCLDRDLRNLDRHAKDMALGRPDPVIEAGLADRPSHEAYIDLVFPTLPHDRRERMARSYIALANRTYWSRLWIVQELSAARKIDLLCGLVKYDWEWLRRFRLEHRLGLDDITPMTRAVPFVVNPQVTSHAWVGSTLPWTSLTSNLHAFRFLSCSDPRDRIYAILSMLEQPKGLLPLRVDYEKSASQLVTDCICHFSYSDSKSELICIEQIGRVTTYLFEGLNVTAEAFKDEPWARMWREIGEAKSSVAEEQDVNSQTSETLDVPTSITALAGFEGKEYFVLDSVNDDSHSLHLQRAHLHRSMFKNKHWPSLDHLQETTNENDYTPVSIGGEVAAIVGPTTQAGDILVSLHHGDKTSERADASHACYLGLVMRKDQANKFRIVGQAFLHPGISPCYGTNGLPGCDYCVGGNEPSLGSLRLVFSVLEWTLLMGSFLMPGLSTSRQQLNPAVSGLFSRSWAEIDEVQLPARYKSEEGSAATDCCVWSGVKVTEEVTTEQKSS